MAALKATLRNAQTKGKNFCQQVRNGNPKFDWADSPKHVDRLELKLAEVHGHLTASDRELLSFSQVEVKRANTPTKLLEMLAGFHSKASKIEELVKMVKQFFELYSKENE